MEDELEVGVDDFCGGEECLKCEFKFLVGVGRCRTGKLFRHRFNYYILVDIMIICVSSPFINLGPVLLVRSNLV